MKQSKTADAFLKKQAIKVGKLFPREVAWLRQNVKANSITHPQLALTLLLLDTFAQMESRILSGVILSPNEWDKFQATFSNFVAVLEAERQKLTGEKAVSA